MNNMHLTFKKYIIFIITYLYLFCAFSYADNVKNITINGNDRVSSETIKVFTSIKLGDEINTDKLNQIIKNLYETNFFENISVNFENHELIMLVIGFAGQALFACRFILQWLTSESVGKSVIPIGFWYCSLGGGSVMLIYAIWREDPVFICGQGVGLLIYLRNLYFIHREKNQKID